MTGQVACRDAEDAVKGRDGYDFDGNSIRVELSRGGTMGMGGGRSMGGGGGGGGSSRDYGGGGGSRDRGGSYGGGSAVPFGRGPPPVAPPNFRSKGSAHRVLVKGLPMSASWQDLKVHAPDLLLSQPLHLPPVCIPCAHTSSPTFRAAAHLCFSVGGARRSHATEVVTRRSREHQARL